MSKPQAMYQLKKALNQNNIKVYVWAPLGRELKKNGEGWIGGFMEVPKTQVKRVMATYTGSMYDDCVYFRFDYENNALFIEGMPLI